MQVKKVLARELKKEAHAIEGDAKRKIAHKVKHKVHMPNLD